MLRLRTKKVLVEAPRTLLSSPDAEDMSEVSFSSIGLSQLDADSTFSEDSHKDSSYLLIHVHEARNLVAKDYETNSSDPFVRVTLGSCSKKTRVIYRNCHPLWEQQLLFPLDGLSEGEPLAIEVFELNNFSKAKQFLGQVLMTLGKAVEIAQDAATAQNYWFGLSKSRSTDIVGGELCLGFKVLDPFSYCELAKEVETQMDSDAIAKVLADRSLHIQLKGINGLLASGLIGDSPTAAAAAAQQQQGKQRRPMSASAKGLSLFVKFGHMTVEKPLPELAPESDGSADDPDSFELTVNEEVFIPLAAAVRAPPPLTARRRDELLDIKLYIKSGATTIAKTQIPIWDIPSVDCASDNADSPLAVADPSITSTAPAPALPTSVPGSPRCTSDCRQTSSPSPPVPAGALSRLLMSRAASLALNGRDIPSSNSDSLGSESAPTTPRGTGRLGFNLTNAAGALASPKIPTASTAATEQYPVMRSAKSEAQLAKLSTSSASASSGREMYVEGSLHSVTACSKPAQHHAHANTILARRRVQGLAELNDNFRAAFKSMLIPGREVCRVGWVPTSRSQGADEGEAAVQAVDLGLKHYRRLMESYVPMYAHLELGVALELVPQIQPVTHASPCEAADDSGGIESDDSEDVPDAPPITLPEPYGLVLQDEELHIGVNRLYALLLGSDSEIMQKHHASENLADMVVGPWKPGGGDCLRTRQASYTKKLNIPVPLAPKQCRVWEEHRVLVKQDGGFVAQHICINDAPKGDCCRALIQICGVFVSTRTSRLRISMMLDWHKDCFGKGIVQTGAEADSKRGWGRLMAVLKQYAACKAGQDLLRLSATTAAASSDGAGADAGGSSTGAAGSKTANKLEWLLIASPGASTLVLAGLLLAVVVLLIVLVAVVWGGARGVSQELHGLNVVLKALANEQCVGSGPAGIIPGTHRWR